MTTYYLDTSALSKLYVKESGTAWVRSLVNPAADHALLLKERKYNVRKHNPCNSR